MNRRRLHDYDDGFDEANLWADENWDLDGDPEYEDRFGMKKELDFEEKDVRYRTRSDPTRWTDRSARADRLADNRRRERKRARGKSWDERH